MTLTIRAEDDDEDVKLSMEFDTDELESNEFVQVMIHNGMDDDAHETLQSFSLSVSDLAAVVTALEKVRDDGWKRENNVR